MTDSPDSKNQRPEYITGAIRTMQDDIAASQPEPFQLRHRRPLPKSNSLEGLQTKKTKPPERPLFHQTGAAKGPITLPSEKKQSRTANSPIIWIAMAVLSVIFLVILILLILTTG